jgi:DNA-binding CsgD family transcriptional regulator
MNARSTSGLEALTEKEKQTLRLIVRGHDAKSTARTLDVSVHTINERLREARRKLAVSSSREAARLLLQAEDAATPPAPQSHADEEIGEAAPPPATHPEGAPDRGARWASRPRILTGVMLMTFVLGLLSLAAFLPTAPVPPQATDTAQETPDPQVVEAARRWLGIVDAGRWDDSYRATGTAFQKLNTVAMWAAASERVRTPLGAVVSRTFLSQENLPAPPSGYEVVKFRTRFANKGDAMETVTLDREDGVWRVVGVTIG